MCVCVVGGVCTGGSTCAGGINLYQGVCAVEVSLCWGGGSSMRDLCLGGLY